MHVCPGFGWDRVHFLPCRWQGAVFWICSENSVDNTGMLYLLVSSAYTESTPFLPLSSQEKGAQEIGREHSQDRWPHLPKGCSIPYGIMVSNKTAGRLVQGHSLGTGWPSVHYWWEIVFICITCLSWLLFSSHYFHFYCHLFLLQFNITLGFFPNY